MRRHNHLYDWAAFDKAYDALPVPTPYGAVAQLAREFNVKRQTAYNHVQTRNGRITPTVEIDINDTPYPLLRDLLWLALDEGPEWSLDKWQRWKRAVTAMLDYYITVIPSETCMGALLEKGA